MPAAAVQESSMVRLAPGGASRSAQLPRSRRRRCTSRRGTTALPCAGSGRQGLHVRHSGARLNGVTCPCLSHAWATRGLPAPAALPHLVLFLADEVRGPDLHLRASGSASEWQTEQYQRWQLESGAQGLMVQHSGTANRGHPSRVALLGCAVQRSHLLRPARAAHPP